MAMADRNSETIEALKAAHPILDVARELGLDVRYNRFRCPAPERHAHGDRTPSVTIWPERGTFKCWVCPDVKGDVIDLVRRMRGCGFLPAVEFLRARGGAVAAPHAARGSHTPRSQTDLFPSRIVPPPPRPPEWSDDDDRNRREVLQALLHGCRPVSGKAAAWLRSRRIFQKTWTAQRLRVVDDYAAISDHLTQHFSPEALRAGGLFNAEGHLRFYRHPLLLPYFDAEGAPVYLQARALEAEIKPKELSLAGPIPCPYNAALLDGEPGHLYLCEGVIDTLTLLEAGFAAVGIPGAANFKPAWCRLFRNKSVFVAFDADAAGEAGAAKSIALLADAGVTAHRLAIPAGKDINEWLRSGGAPHTYR